MNEAIRNARAVLVFASVCGLTSACGKADRTQVSSSSHWLECHTVDDCPSEVGAVACSSEGYCVDAAGARIEADRAALGPDTTAESAMGGTRAMSSTSAI